jgi:hypothetical protein
MRYVILILFSVNLVGAQVNFTESAQQLGININCEYTFLGNGVAFFDYDNDGLDDITVATALGDPIYFYKNINGNFVSQTLNIPNNNERNKQINWVDIDNDGDNDLFITSDNSGNRLFENLGNMIMSEITSTSGMLTDNFPYYGASWGDYDNDGYLDVFICVRDSNIPNILYKNNGDKTFSLVNDEAGLLSDGYMSFCSVFLDYDNDGDQDIYVSNDKYANPNLMYKNNGDGTFTEVGVQSGTAVSIDAMTVTVEDLNYDGWLDIYVTNDPNNNVLFINNGDGTFTDMAQSYQVTFNSTSWGAVFLDADNDKDLDLYVSGEGNGTTSPFLSSAFYENMNSSFFQLDNSAVPNDYSYSYGNAIGDTDNDGYPEIVVNNIDHNNIFVWKNNTNTSNNWLKVKLEGTTSNRNGVGSFIEISINGNKQYRYTCLGEGYLSQNSATEQFGLGSDTVIDYVKVKWLSGIEDTMYNVSANQNLNIIEGSTTLSVNDYNLNNIVIYPNPTKDVININAKTLINTVTVNNVLGEEILNITPNSLISIIDLSVYNAGVYFVHISTENNFEVIKIIKQ